MPASQNHIQPLKAAFGCFLLEHLPPTNDNPPRKRARFTPQRRKEVALLRGKTCLRCRLLKLRCSGDNPCQTCFRVASWTTQSKHLRFSYCIRASLKDLSIFGYSLPPQAMTEAILGKAKDLISASIELSFPFDFEWNLDSLSQHVLSWLGNPAKSPTSKVGILCSTGFQRLIQAQVGSDLSHAFQQMLLACTTAYNREKGAETSQFSYEELQQITSVAGEYVLASLERRLTPAELEKNMATLEYSQALFLVLLGTILAVSYMEPIHDPLTSDIASHVDSTLSKPLYESVQEHLCATLAHYMIYLSHKTRTIFDPPTQEHLITKAHERWHVQGRFEWNTTVQFQETSSDGDSKFANTSNSGEERAASLTVHELCEEASEEFGLHKWSELFDHNHVRHCSSFSRFSTDAESIMDDHRITPLVWTQDAFAGSAGIGMIYDPTTADLPDHTVGSIATTNVLGFLEDTAGPRSQSVQFSTSDITTNSSLDIMVDSSTMLSSASIRQPAIEEMENTVEKLDTPLCEMPLWSTIPVGSSTAWKETVNTDLIQVMKERTPLSKKKNRRKLLVGETDECIVCLERVRCDPNTEICDPCSKAIKKQFQNLNANNDLLRSHLNTTTTELEKRRELVPPRTNSDTNELHSDSSERLTTGNTTFDLGWTRKVSSQTSQQYPATEPFTKEDVRATSTNLPRYKQHSSTDEFSQDLIMLIDGEGSGRLVPELNVPNVTARGDVHERCNNSTKHFKAGGGGSWLVSMKFILRRFLV
ncbi:hypothetical protein L207DRAFT_583292 [Hyaloscypha variabilis F]|uniref:Zn(2)-C6 fungal-type domain-containing protein n=1 Tax=Hyaloscypha variabilis (strain UAMH 11265 / GT02V1 / F) TaxID=1149755 RepID=A0A2J6RLP2_HYAVF|nr:hypothetical protein L207DRAFT_583292 [Hyaloscypha variabilis F]